MRGLRLGALLLAWLCWSATALAAPFAQSGDKGARVMLGDVGCYGEYDLIDQFEETLKDVLASNLQESDRFALQTAAPDTELLQRAHMDAIVRGHLYRRGMSNAALIRYSFQVLGENYRPTEAELKEQARSLGRPYALSREVSQALGSYAEANGVDYFVFCNLKHLAVWLRNSMFDAPVTQDMRGKAFELDTDYFLVNARTGMVYDGASHCRKSARMLNIWELVRTGKGMPMNLLVKEVLDLQAKEMLKDISHRGLGVLK